MSVDDGSNASPSSTLKRKRAEDGSEAKAEGSEGAAHAPAPKAKAEPPTASASASQLASGLKTASPDTLRIALTSLRQATQIANDEDPLASIGSKDKRLLFAREFLQDHNGRDRIFEAWQRVHETGIMTLMPLPVFVLANLVTLTSVHPADNDLALSLIQPIAPSKSSDALSFWNRLHGYLLNSQARYNSQQQQGGSSGGSSEVVIVASLQLLTSMARFESGRFARSIVENLAWNAKSIFRLASLRRRSGKDKKGKSSGAQTKAAATFNRPDIRLLYIQLLLVILHPRIVPDIDSESKQPETVDSGVSTATKLLLINSDHAQSSIQSVFKTLADDPPSVVQHFLHVLDRALLRDSKLPRGSLVSLAKSVDLLTTLLHLAGKSGQVEKTAMEMMQRLCAQPGKGVCFQDRGWYGRMAASRTDGDADPGQLEDEEVRPPNEASSTRSSTSGIHNPMIGFFIQSQQFSPLYNEAHRELLMTILKAAPELQPVFLNSTRTVFGGGRLEPPVPEAGARLSGLLANRLMGLLLDLALPRNFDGHQAPSGGKLISAVFPHTLARANLIKGLRHPDRLVRWSTLDLLSRLLGRIGRMLAVCARFARQEETWLVAGRALLRECAKRLPDLSTIMGASEAIAVPTKDGATASTSAATPNTSQDSTGKVDWVLLEGSLRSGLRYMRLARRRFGTAEATALSTGGYDFRSLLSAPYLVNAAADESSSEAKELLPLIQLHAIKLLRLAKLQLASASSGSDSLLAQVIELLMSPENSPEARAEAASLLKEAFGGASSSNDDSAASNASLIFEGDQGEFEAWVAALPTGSDATSRSRRATAVGLLEECLSRCSKNTYRYLEAARTFGGDDDEEASGLCVSPLFATFAEQLSIKLEKGIYADSDAQLAVLQYLRRLMPLLIGRSRPGAQQAMLAYHAKLLAVAQEKKLGEERMVTLKGARSVIDWASVADEASSKGKKQRADALSTLDFYPEVPASYPSLLLVDPASATSGASALPPSILLLHAHQQAVKSKASSKPSSKAKPGVDDIALLNEDAAMASLTLRLIADLLVLPKRSQDVDALLLRCLDHTLAATASHASLGRSFFGLPQMVKAIESCNAKVLSAVTETIASRLDPARSDIQGELRSWASTCAEHHGLSGVTRPLIAFMGEDALDLLWQTALQTPGLSGEAVQMLREVAALGARTASAAEVAQLLALGSQLPADDGARGELVALLLSIIDDSRPGGSGAGAQRHRHTPQASLPDASLGWLTADLPGTDELQSRLIYRFKGGLALLDARLASGSKAVAELVASMPLSVLAWLNVHATVHQARDDDKTPLPLTGLVAPLAKSAFDSTRSAVAGDSLGLLYLLLTSGQPEEEQSASDLLSAFLQGIPNKPGDAFQTGALTFAASLVATLKGQSTDSSSALAVSQIAQRLLDQGLLWLVRRFAEDEADEAKLLDTIDAFGTLLYRCAEEPACNAKSAPHLADPVIEAAIKRRLTEKRQMDLVRLLVITTDLKPASAASHTANLLAHSQFRAAAAASLDDEAGKQASSSRRVLVSVLHSLGSQHPEQVLTPQNLQSLLAIYGGTISLSDRQLFDLFQLAEGQLGRGAFSNLARAWSADGSRSTGALDALLSLDSARTFSTCTAFPRERDLEHLSAGDVPSSEGPVPYDPLWVLTVLTAAMSSQQTNESRITGLEWLAIVRTNALGVAVISLSSKRASTRRMAATAIARAYAGISGSDVQEKHHLMLNLDVVRSLLAEGSEDGGASISTALPLTTTLFLAHHLRLVGSPSSVLFPPVSRFLLQRPTFDSTDVPMLYATLQSTDPDHWRAHRLWMLRFLRDVAVAGGVALEWRVMKRRYVWDLLASMYVALRRSAGAYDVKAEGDGAEASTPSVTRQSLRMIEETMLALVSKPRVASELLTRKGLLPWILQQVTLEGGSSSGNAAQSIEEAKVDDDASQEDEAAGRDDGTSADFKLLLLRRALGDDASIWDRLDRSLAGESWTSTVLAILDGLASRRRESDGFPLSSSRQFVEVLHVVATRRQTGWKEVASPDLLLRLLKQTVGGLELTAASRQKSEAPRLASKVLECLLGLQERGEKGSAGAAGAIFSRALALAMLGDEGQRWRAEHITMLHS